MKGIWADFPLAPSHADDGACVVYVAVRPTLRPDVFSFTGISENAQRVLEKCVADPRVDSGGIIGDLGELNRVLFAKGRFHSHPLVLEPLSPGTAGSHPAPEIADRANLAGHSI